MRHRLGKTGLLVAVLLLAGLVTPAEGRQDPPDAPNADFADAIRFFGPGVSQRIENRDGPPETGEFLFPWLPPRRVFGIRVFGRNPNSLWWKWTPGYTHWVTVDTGLSENNFDTVLGVYSGTGTLRDLTRNGPVDWDDDSGHGQRSRVTFRAIRGRVYWFVAGGDKTCEYVEYYNIFNCHTGRGDLVLRLRNA